MTDHVEMTRKLMARLRLLADHAGAPQLYRALQSGGDGVQSLVAVRFHALRQLDRLDMPDESRSILRNLIVQLTADPKS